MTLGLFWGAWAAVLPSVQEATGALKGALGLALLFVTAGAIPSMLFIGGPLVERYGAPAVAVMCAAFAAASTLPGFAGSLPLLVLALAATGAASGALDVGINANAAQIEASTGKRVMPLAHGLYSVGILVGAVAAGIARSQGVGRDAILLGRADSVRRAAVLPRHQPGAGSAVDRHRRWGSGSSGCSLLIGLVGAAAFIVEGGIESWSAIFLEHQLHAEPAVSGLGPGVFAASMAIGRFFGQATRLGDRTLLAGGAGLAAVGCVVAATAPSAAVALLGFMLAGAGISLNAPIVFGAGGRRGANAVATVTTIGYVGLLIGPPLVGGIAQAASLRGLARRARRGRGRRGGGRDPAATRLVR